MGFSGPHRAYFFIVGGKEEISDEEEHNLPVVRP